MTVSKLDPLAVPAAEAARLCGIDRAQWYKLQSMGKAPRPVNLGTRAPRWVVDELKAWLAAGCPNRDKWEGMKGGQR